MDKIEKLNDIYSRIPKLRCVDGCSGCCGIVDAGKAEVENITAFLKAKGKGFKPFNSCTEQQVIDVITDKSKDESVLKCSYLEDGRCSIYEVRPVICRLFGVVRDLKCPNVACDDYLTGGEARDIIHSVLRL